MAFIIKNGILTTYIPEKGETRVVIPEGVTEIGWRAFEKCARLTRVTIPEGVTKIGAYAFSDCDRLTKVVIPESVTTIGDGAFESCVNLANVVLQGKVSTIGDGAFFCTSLTNLTLPDSVTTIGDFAFGFCSSLTYLEGQGVTALGQGCVYKTPLSAAIFPKVPLAGLSTDAKCLLLTGFFRKPELYDEIRTAEYLKFLSFRRSKLLPVCFEKDDVVPIRVLAEHGKINVKNFQNEYFKPAQAAGATSCVAYLLEWKNKNITPEAEEKALERELMRDPLSAAELKKLWKYETAADGTVRLIAYLGAETDVVVPERVGRRPVSSIGDYPFHIFAQLRNIRSIYIPESITSIGYRAFRGFENLTIHAPAGSFAIKFARKHHIHNVEE